MKTQLVIGIIGQSNCYPMLTGAAHAPTHPDLVRVFIGETPVADGVGTYGEQACNSYGLSAIADAVHATYLIPIKFIYNPLGGTSFAYWLTHKKPSEVYGQFVAQVKQNADHCDFIIHMGGESEAADNTVSPDQFKTNVRALYNSLLNDLGTFKYILTRIGYVIAESGSTDALIKGVQKAQIELIAENIGILDGGSLLSIPTNDGIHIKNDATGAAVVGTALGNVIVSQLSLPLYPQPDIIETKTANNNTELTFNKLIEGNDHVVFDVSLQALTDDVSLWIRFGDAAGIKTGVNDYKWTFQYVNSIPNGSYTPTGKGYGSGINRIVCNDNGGGTGIGNGTGKNIAGKLHLYKKFGIPIMQFDLEFTDKNGDLSRVTGTGNYVGTTMINDRIQFLMSSGNMSGVISARRGL